MKKVRKKKLVNKKKKNAQKLSLKELREAAGGRMGSPESKTDPLIEGMS